MMKLRVGTRMIAAGGVVTMLLLLGCASMPPTAVQPDELGRLKGRWVGTRYTTVKGSTQRYELPTTLEITGQSRPIEAVWHFHQTRTGTRTFSDSFHLRDGKLVGQAVLALHSDGKRLELRGEMDLAEYHEYFVLQKE